MDSYRKLAIFLLSALLIISFFSDCGSNKLKEGRKAGERKVIKVNGLEFAFRWCPPGKFAMGSPEDEDHRSSDERQHDVTLTKGFWMMETEVTQEQWKMVMENNPSHFEGDDLPVETVTFDSCQSFCEKCSQLGLPVQLPTEAQWEYACRAGTTGAYAGDLDEMAWYDKDNWGGNTHQGGKKTPNAWGLYDMHGNVREWCTDWYGDYPYGSVKDPVGSSTSTYHIYRGGSWDDPDYRCRSAHREDIYPTSANSEIGFRCIIVIKTDQDKKADKNQDKKKDKK